MAIPAARAVRLYCTGIRLEAGIRCHPYRGESVQIEIPVPSGSLGRGNQGSQMFVYLRMAVRTKDEHDNRWVLYRETPRGRDGQITCTQSIRKPLFD